MQDGVDCLRVFEMFTRSLNQQMQILCKNREELGARNAALEAQVAQMSQRLAEIELDAEQEHRTNDVHLEAMAHAAAEAARAAVMASQR